jgi:phospholipid/cholesterol/gamma-HCH transport system substrate-binding protein
MTEPPSESDRSRSMRRQNLMLIAVALLLALLLGGGIAWQNGRFSNLAEVYFLADDANSLAPGTAVRLSGFRVGRITAMQLQPDLKVKVTLMIEADAFAYLKRDARAELVREQLKPAAIELRAGSAADTLAAADPRVGYDKRNTLTEVAEDLRARVAPILADVKNITGSVSDRRGDIQDLLANSRQVTQDLAAAAKELRTLSAGLKTQVGKLGGEANATLADAHQAVGRVNGLLDQAGHSLDAINTRLPTLMQRADTTLTNLEAVTRDARAVTAKAATDLPPLIGSVGPLVDEAAEVVRGLRQAWPVKGLLAPPPPLLLPIDSHDSQALRQIHAR